MKKSIRISVDCGMVLLLPLLMSYSLVGETVHEYLGMFMFFLFLAHNILNIKWWKNIFHGKYNYVRILRLIVDVLIFIIMISLTISGIVMSRHIFRFLNINGSSAARTIHLFASYWGLILMSFHAGMHIVKIPYIKKKIFILFFVLLGISAFIRRNIIDYLFLKSQFVFIDFSQSVIMSICDYLFISILFMIVGYSVTRLLNSLSIHRR